MGIESLDAKQQAALLQQRVRDASTRLVKSENDFEARYEASEDLLFTFIPKTSEDKPGILFRNVDNQFEPVERMAIGHLDLWCNRYGQDFSLDYNIRNDWLVSPNGQNFLLNLGRFYLESTRKGGVFAHQVFRALVDIDQSYRNLLRDAS